VRYFLIAGEASGDQHAGRLMKSLFKLDKQAEFAFLGGERMSETGGEPIVHIREMAFMGFTQVIANIGKIRKNFRKAKEGVLKFLPDVIIFIDYPGFNMRMAAWAKKLGFRTHYYIPPSVWAWNTRRIYKLKKNCDRIFTILPFEKDFYKRYGLEVEYAGNPVFEAISSVRPDLSANGGSDEKKIALLPGSRRQEISRMLPVMLSVMPFLPGYRFVIAALSDHREMYKDIAAKKPGIEIIYNQPLEVLKGSSAALVTSGTATLETALMGIPQVVCYKSGTVSYLIARSLIKVPYISLVNLILQGPAIPELIQGNCNTRMVAECLKSIVPGGANHSDQLKIAAMVGEKLGDPEVSGRLAGLIYSDLERLG
jgi:lipid-A-disaccharide synthase